MRGPNRFLESEVARAVKAARKAGGQSVVEIDPVTGKIRVFLGNQDEAAKAAEHNEWDDEYGEDQTEVRQRIQK